MSMGLEPFENFWNVPEPSKNCLNLLKQGEVIQNYENTFRHFEAYAYFFIASWDLTNCVEINKSWLRGPKVWGEIRIAFLFAQKWVKLDNFKPFHNFTDKYISKYF